MRICGFLGFGTFSAEAKEPLDRFDDFAEERPFFSGLSEAFGGRVVLIDTDLDAERVEFRKENVDEQVREPGTSSGLGGAVLLGPEEGGGWGTSLVLESVLEAGFCNLVLLKEEAGVLVS